jgi:hypothetical protein
MMFDKSRLHSKWPGWFARSRPECILIESAAGYQLFFITGGEQSITFVSRGTGFREVGTALLASIFA